MLTYLQYCSQYSLIVPQYITIDNGDPLPLRLAVRKLWLHYGLETPDFKLNGSPDRLNGQDLKKILLRLGIDSSLDPRLGWIASYPSLLMAIALFSPKEISYAKNSDPLFLRENFGSVIYLLEDSLNLLDNRSGQVLSHNGLGSICHAIYPFPRYGKIKQWELREIRELSEDDKKYEKRFVGVAKRFNVKSRSLEPANDHPYLRDQSQDKYLLAFSVKNVYIDCQLNLLFNPNHIRIENKLILGYLEFRTINHKIGSRSAIKIAELAVMPDNRMRFTFNEKIDQIVDPIELAAIAKMLPLLGVNKTVKGKTNHGIADIHCSSQLMESSTWLKVGVSVTIAINPNGTGKIWYKNIDKKRNLDPSRNKRIQASPPMQWDPIGKGDPLPDPIKGAKKPRTADNPYDQGVGKVKK